VSEDKKGPNLEIRHATNEHIEGIIELGLSIYPTQEPYAPDTLRGQIINFPQGQFIALYDGKIVGYCATIRVPEEKAMSKHSWNEITGGGFGSTHDPLGDWLYGVEVFVDKSYRGLKIGDRFYKERRKLCKILRLKGIVFGARMPLMQKWRSKINEPEDYLELVREKKIKDPVITLQIRNGFEPIGVLPKYSPEDRESLGFAAHMLWRNPEMAPDKDVKSTYGGGMADTVRIASIQYMQRAISSFTEFEKIITYFIDVVADYKADFVLFPELFTLQLLSIENEAVSPEVAVDKLTQYTPKLLELFKRMAIKYNVNIIAGSHPTKVSENLIQNIAYVFLRDGSIHAQPKIHPTPNERYWWNIKGGNRLSVIETDCGPIGVLICYDSEFPELGRHLVNQGANIIFVPFCTDERQSYLRVRYCAQARAVENQCYVVMSGNVGNLPNVQNMDIQYAQSCILTPCDFPFARDGIAADTTPNVETVAIADLRLESLLQARVNGTVLNLKDRRHDLYSIVWHNKE